MNPFSLTTVLGLAAAMFLAVLPAGADVRLPSLTTEGMVLQRGVPVKIQGWADEGEKVTVAFRGQSVSSVAKDGKWSVTLKPMKAGGPFPMRIAGNKVIEFKDVMVGDVWVCSGQSNMEWPLNMLDAKEDIAKSANPSIRLFQLAKVNADRPADDVEASWKVCGPETVADFSAVGYYFGRDLQKSLGVPIGLIDSSWGGSPIEPWTRNSYYAANPELKEIIARTSSNGHVGAGWAVGGLYNGMIAPLVWYPIKGVIWYQGESNCERAKDYYTLLPATIRNWRADWGVGDFPFLIVQIAPFDATTAGGARWPEGSWAELRESQLLTSRSVPRTALVVTTDIGDCNNIHPTRKVPVGERLALAAKAIGYRKKIEYSGPIYRSMKVSGNKIVLRFSHVGKGLTAEGDELKGFEIASADGKYVPAKAVIEGNTVVVSSEQVQKPAAARYGWANCPDVNLFNKNGLPASPFRTTP